MVIEIDGGQHYQDENIFNDKVRSKTFAEYGIEVLRFTNIDIDKNFEGVCQIIEETIKNKLSLHR